MPPLSSAPSNTPPLIISAAMDLNPTPVSSQFQSVCFAHLVHHGSRGQRLDDPSPTLPVDNKMVQQQANELVGGEIIASSVHATHAVGVAIRHEANVVWVLLEERRAARIVLFHRFRIDAAEKHVVLAVQRRHSASRAREQFLEATRAHAEQRLVCKPQLGFGDELEVHEPFQCGEVGGPDVLDPDLLGFDPVGERLCP